MSNADDIWDQTIQSRPDLIDWWNIPIQYGNGYVTFEEPRYTDCGKWLNSKKFNCQQRTIRINFPNIEVTFSEANNIISNIFEEVVKEAKKNMNDQDRVRFYFDHPSFDKKLTWHYMKKNEFDLETILSQFYN